MLRRYLVVGLAFALTASGAMAQTFAEFMTAVQNAADGDVVAYDLAFYPAGAMLIIR